jgi:hypothetical protein
MISSSYLEQCNIIQNIATCTVKDKTILAQIILYGIIYKLLDSKSIRTGCLVWDELERWRLSSSVLGVDGKHLNRCGEQIELIRLYRFTVFCKSSFRLFLRIPHPVSTFFEVYI